MVAAAPVGRVVPTKLVKKDVAAATTVSQSTLPEKGRPSAAPQRDQLSASPMGGGRPVGRKRLIARLSRCAETHGRAAMWGEPPTVLRRAPSIAAPTIIRCSAKPMATGRVAGPMESTAPPSPRAVMIGAPAPRVSCPMAVTAVVFGVFLGSCTCQAPTRQKGGWLSGRG